MKQLIQLGKVIPVLAISLMFNTHVDAQRREWRGGNTSGSVRQQAPSQVRQQSVSPGFGQDSRPARSFQRPAQQQNMQPQSQVRPQAYEQTSRPGNVFQKPVQSQNVPQQPERVAASSRPIRRQVSPQTLNPEVSVPQNTNTINGAQVPEPRPFVSKPQEAKPQGVSKFNPGVIKQHVETRPVNPQPSATVTNRRPGYNPYNPSWQYSNMPRRNSRVRYVPAGYRNIYYGGSHYRYCNGIFYRPYYDGFMTVAPPVGIYVDFLPFGYRKLFVRNRPYYYYYGSYYDYRDNYYHVVSPPVGAVVESLPEGYETIVIDGETYYEADGAQYKPVVQENGEIWYEVIRSN